MPVPIFRKHFLDLIISTQSFLLFFGDNKLHIDKYNHNCNFKVILLVYLVYLYNMRNILSREEKKVKITISINPKLNLLMEDNLINKSRLIEKLLFEYYGNKNL